MIAIMIEIDPLSNEVWNLYNAQAQGKPGGERPENARTNASNWKQMRYDRTNFFVVKACCRIMSESSRRGEATRTLERQI